MNISSTIRKHQTNNRQKLFNKILAKKPVKIFVGYTRRQYTVHYDKTITAKSNHRLRCFVFVKLGLDDSSITLCLLNSVRVGTACYYATEVRTVFERLQSRSLVIHEGQIIGYLSPC